ncbi:MAG: fibronectin type III domain-containing protein, partial [Planctomycetota bacterium]
MSSKQIALRSLMFFIILVVAGVSQGAIRKGPYLIYPGNNTQMMVLWQLDSSQSCSLEWGLDPNYSSGSIVTAEYGTDHQHKHTTTGLVPGSKYYYRLTVDPNQYTGSFRAAPPEDVNAVKFLAYGDTRANGSIFDHDMVDEGIVSAFEDDPNYHTFT